MAVVAYLSLSGSGREMGWGGRLLTFSAFWMGAYSRLGAYSNKYGTSQHDSSSYRMVIAALDIFHLVVAILFLRCRLSAVKYVTQSKKRRPDDTKT